MQWQGRAASRPDARQRGPTSSNQDTAGKNGENGRRDTGTCMQSRRIVFEQLTPWTACTIRARAVGGTTGLQ